MSISTDVKIIYKICIDFELNRIKHIIFGQNISK